MNAGKSMARVKVSAILLLAEEMPEIPDQQTAHPDQCLKSQNQANRPCAAHAIRAFGFGMRTVGRHIWELIQAARFYGNRRTRRREN